MTLYNLLVDQVSTEAKLAVDNIRDSKEYYKGLGRIEMCDKLFNMLSDDTLNMEVTTRHEALKKGE